jgi:hypothetical protein
MSEPELTPDNELLEKVKAVAESQGQGIPLEGDHLAMVAEEDLDTQRIKIEVEHLRDQVAAYKETHDLRKEYIPKLFWLTVAWLAFVGITLWRAADIGGRYFHLSDNVLITLITSTTINVIGIFMLAARWLFPSKK